MLLGYTRTGCRLTSNSNKYDWEWIMNVDDVTMLFIASSAIKNQITCMLIKQFILKSYNCIVKLYPQYYSNVIEQASNYIVLKPHQNISKSISTYTIKTSM